MDRPVFSSSSFITITPFCSEIVHQGHHSGPNACLQAREVGFHGALHGFPDETVQPSYISLKIRNRNRDLPHVFWQHGDIIGDLSKVLEGAPSLASTFCASPKACLTNRRNAAAAQ